MKLKIMLFLLAIFILIPSTVFAIEDPRVVLNNRFGIHILDENDLDPASSLVNSSGGDWGYVTLVIREDERNHLRWQRAFDEMRELHLIPIVRIASTQTNSHWNKLEKNKIDDWVDFLDSLNWVVSNRYVIIGNEVNHAKEWGNEINPEEYSDYLIEISKRLKGKSDQYFVLPAGLDASAPNDKLHMSESIYIQKMIEQNEDVFEHIDGWNSHSYPNPNFSGSENDVGRGTVMTFKWELEYLKSLGVDKDLPVFITETGWAHDVDGSENDYLSAEEVSKMLKTSFETCWNDEDVVAITPFILNYQGEPFNIFSWTKKDGSHYEFYEEIRNIKKLTGDPKRENSAEITAVLFPEIIAKDGHSYGIAYLKNTGQVIWNKNEKQAVMVASDSLEVEPISYKEAVLPKQNVLAFYRKI